MTGLPHEGTPMGKLTIVHTFLKFDVPRLFTCVSESGQHYLALFVDVEEARDLYAYSAVSTSRLAAIQSGQLPLRLAFEEPSDGGLWVADDDETCEWRETPIPQDWLPHPSITLNMPTATQGPLDRYELQREAAAIRRDIFALELDTPWGTTEYPVEPATAIMSLVQETVESLGQIVEDKPTNRGAIQSEIRSGTELSIYGLRAASFALLLAASPAVNTLFGPRLASESISMLMTIFDSSSSEESLQHSLQSLHPRAIKKLRTLYESLDGKSESIGVIHARSDGTSSEVRISQSMLDASLRILNAIDQPIVRDFEIRGHLLGANERLRSFELHDEELDRRYTGKVPVDGARLVTGLTVGDTYLVTLRETLEIATATGEETPKYSLIAISPLSPDLALE